jgi:isoquinoline 1-oxidoreductase beta subunit
MRDADSDRQDQTGVSRRTLMIGAAATGGLALAWTVWPRAYAPAINTAPGEQILSAYLKVGTDGHVTVLAPQAELGQGNVTLIAQILADELGADWRTIAVEAAPVTPLYANPSLGHAWHEGRWSSADMQGTDEALDFGRLEPVLRRSAAAAARFCAKPQASAGMPVGTPAPQRMAS